MDKQEILKALSGFVEHYQHTMTADEPTSDFEKAIGYSLYGSALSGRVLVKQLGEFITDLTADVERERHEREEREWFHDYGVTRHFAEIATDTANVNGVWIDRDDKRTIRTADISPGGTGVGEIVS
jgi:hypothetical protein